MKNNKLIYAMATGLMFASISCFADTCGSTKQFNTCADKYPTNLGAMTQEGFELSDVDMDIAEKAVAYAKGPCSCMGSANPDYKKELAFAKAKLPAMIKKAKSAPRLMTIEEENEQLAREAE